jgi:glycosyltransferase involved in cell wall biosynthesis
VRIALTADPEVPVPPTHYGGIERIVAMVARGLAARGHEVTLFAHPDSSASVRLAPYPGRQSGSRPDLLRNMRHVGSEIARGRYDLVHSFGRLAYLLPILPRSVPALMSYQRDISSRSVAWGERLSRGRLHFSGCSRFLIRRWAGRPNWHVVYNATAADAYTPRERVDDDAPLVFLGRVEEIKGPHVAIEVARTANIPLIIAGNIPEGEREQAFFQHEIQPHIDGLSVSYLGPVDDAQKNELLGRARALLMPILWDEPFGIVMAEALACGTPVIGLRRGAVPEVVKDGVTGYVCDSSGGMVEAVGALGRIDRRACRQDMEARFSESVMVDEYLRVYEEL